MNRTIYLTTISVLVMMLLSPLTSQAEEIIISDIPVTTIESPDSLHQCALILEFGIPDDVDLGMIMFAELTGRMAFELPDGMPMTLGCVSIPTDQEMDGQSFEYIKENLSGLFDLTQLSTASFGEASGDTAFFNITDSFQNWTQDPEAFSGLLIIPLESSSIFNGLNQQDPMLEIRVSYSTMDME